MKNQGDNGYMELFCMLYTYKLWMEVWRLFQYFDIYNPGHLIQVVTMCPLIKSTAN